MGTKPETAIVRKIINKLRRKRNFDGYHVHGSMLQRRGEPDITGDVWSDELQCWMHIKLEVKTKTGKPSELQLARLREYHRRGYVAGLVTSADEAENVISAYEVWRSMKLDSPQVPFRVIAARRGIVDEYGIYEE